MKCQGCGHEYPSTFPRCSRCGELTPRRTLRSSPSRLIEFPRKARIDVEKESSESLVPSWRRELNEKVRAVRARRNAVGTEASRVETTPAQQESRQEVQVDTRGRRADSSARTFRTSPAVAKAAPAISTPDVPRTSNAIVEAALSRVRRATENASRAALSRIEPVRSMHQNPAPSMSIDKEATARALEVTIDINPKPVISAPPLASVRTQQARPRELTQTPDLSPKVDPPAAPVLSPKFDSPPAAQAPSPKVDPPAAPVLSPKFDSPPAAQAPSRTFDPPAAPVLSPKFDSPPAAQAPSRTVDLPVAPVLSPKTEQHEQTPDAESTRTAAQPAPRRTVIDPPVTVPESVEAEVSEVSIRILDEDEPLDYLQAEIRKIDRKRAEEEFAHNESPSLGIHAVIAVVDLLTIAVSSIPFLVVIRIMDGTLGDGRTEIAAGLIVLLVSFFYLAVTQCLSGKTFGMMMTNTRIVDVYTFEAPSGQRLLLRTIGYFVAIAPATLGLIWIAFNRYRRGWHDVISGTRVVRDF